MAGKSTNPGYRKTKLTELSFTANCANIVLVCLTWELVRSRSLSKKHKSQTALKKANVRSCFAPGVASTDSTSLFKGFA